MNAGQNTDAKQTFMITLSKYWKKYILDNHSIIQILKSKRFQSTWSFLVFSVDTMQYLYVGETCRNFEMKKSERGDT